MQDLADVQNMVRTGLVDPGGPWSASNRCSPTCTGTPYRYPAVDPRAFRGAVEEAFQPGGQT